MLYGSDASQFGFDSCRGLRWIPFVRPVPHQQHHLYALRRAGECVSQFDECFVNWFLLQPPHPWEVSVSLPGSNLAEAKSVLAAMMAEVRELKQAAGGSITDAVADWLAPQYLLAAREKLDGTEGARRWEILRLFAQDWATLRRGDHSAARLVLDRERLAFERECAGRARFSEFWKWTKRPEIKKKLWPPKKGGISKATFRKIERELRLL
jgi:hypothetical protein